MRPRRGGDFGGAKRQTCSEQKEKIRGEYTLTAFEVLRIYVKERC